MKVGRQATANRTSSEQERSKATAASVSIQDGSQATEMAQKSGHARAKPEAAVHARLPQLSRLSHRKGSQLRVSAAVEAQNKTSQAQQGPLDQVQLDSGPELEEVSLPATEKGTKGQGQAALPEQAVMQQSSIRQTASRQPSQQAPQSPMPPPGEPNPGAGLLSKMRSKLQGSRFRWLNEQLYTGSGQEAYQLMQSDPAVFQEYHEV